MTVEFQLKLVSNWIDYLIAWCKLPGNRFLLVFHSYLGDFCLDFPSYTSSKLIRMADFWLFDWSFIISSGVRSTQCGRDCGHALLISVEVKAKINYLPSKWIHWICWSSKKQKRKSVNLNLWITMFIDLYNLLSRNHILWTKMIIFLIYVELVSKNFHTAISYGNGVDYSKLYFDG